MTNVVRCLWIADHRRHWDTNSACQLILFYSSLKTHWPLGNDSLDKSSIETHSSAIVLSSNLVLCCSKDGQLRLFRNSYEVSDSFACWIDGVYLSFTLLAQYANVSIRSGLHSEFSSINDEKCFSSLSQRSSRPSRNSSQSEYTGPLGQFDCKRLWNSIKSFLLTDQRILNIQCFFFLFAIENKARASNRRGKNHGNSTTDACRHTRALKV